MSTKPVKDDNSAGKDALDKLRAELLAIPRDQVITPNCDVEAAAAAVIAIADKVNEPGLLARFQSLPHDEFDIANVLRLRTVAQATWYTVIERATAEATDSEAKVPADLAARAAENKARMMKVVEYHLGDHPTHAAEIASIRTGTGYQDLASDLTRLARLYRAEKAVLDKDTKLYRSGDARQADDLAHMLLTALGIDATAPNAESRALGFRAWTLLSRVYEEVAAAGRWLLRHEGGDAIFPSLVTLGRTAPTRSRKKPAAGDPSSAPPAA